VSVARFYPHRAAPERIRLALDPVGTELETGPDGALLADQEEIETITLNCSAAVPAGLAEEVLPPDELARPPLEMLLVYTSIESRKRTAQRLEGDGNVYHGQLTLRRQDWRGSIEIEAVLIRTTTNPSVPAGFASDRGSRLSWSEPWRVVFDTPPLPPGDRIQVCWEEFSRSDDPWLRAHRDNLFALSTAGERPVIYLNREIPGAVTILSSLGTRGRKARIRDATHFMIAHQVWSSLLAMTLTDLAATDRELSAEERLGDLRDWQRRMLIDWSRYLYPDEDAQTALERLVAAAGDPVQTGEVMRRLPNAIQDRFRTFRGFEGLAQEIHSL
jgi:hypothetical protein